MPKLYKIIKYLIGVVLLLYIVGLVLLYFFQEKILFNPYKLEETHIFKSGTELEIPVTKDLTINTLVRSFNEKDKDVVLYLHGNRGNNNFGLYQTGPMADYTGTVYIPDYRSYGKTEGKLSSDEQKISDMEKVLEYINDSREYKNVTIVGFSMGSGMAAALAKKYPIKQLILVAPYTSLTDLKDGYLPIVPDIVMKYDFPIKDYLADISCPVAIVHGNEDNVIPYRHSQKLDELYPSKISFFTANGTSHRRVIFSRALTKCYEDMLDG